jgi:hypothetical protein
LDIFAVCPLAKTINTKRQIKNIHDRYYFNINTLHLVFPQIRNISTRLFRFKWGKRAKKYFTLIYFEAIYWSVSLMKTDKRYSRSFNKNNRIVYSDGVSCMITPTYISTVCYNISQTLTENIHVLHFVIQYFTDLKKVTNLGTNTAIIVFFILKWFVALIRAGYTCSVTKLFPNTTNSQQYLTIAIDGNYRAKLRQWKL